MGVSGEEQNCRPMYSQNCDCAWLHFSSRDCPPKVRSNCRLTCSCRQPLKLLTSGCSLISGSIQDQLKCSHEQKVWTLLSDYLSKEKAIYVFFFFFSYFDRWDLLNNVICIKNCVKYSKGEATKLFFNKYVTAYYVSNSWIPKCHNVFFLFCNPTVWLYLE